MWKGEVRTIRENDMIMMRGPCSIHKLVEDRIWQLDNCTIASES
jgi:hypothetical protein